MLIGVFISLILTLSFSVRPTRAEESLETILATLGFTNVAESSVETFPAGFYEAILYAEIAGYSDTNELSYYPVNTSDFHIIFSGPEGGSGYITPPLNKTFSSDAAFGLSMYVPIEGHRYYTEFLRNPDGQNHSKIYVNLDEPDMYLIGFENLYGLGDRDYNDMVFSIQSIDHYLTVETDPAGIATIPGEGDYNHYANVTLNAPETIAVDAGTRYEFSHWTVDGISQGIAINPIVVLVDADHTATAHYVLQYYLTMSTNFGTVSPGSGWHDAGSVITISTTGPISPRSSGERYAWNGWTGSGNGSYSGIGNPTSITMNGPITQTASWSHQYRLIIATNLGSTTPSVGENWYDAGTVVAISATTPSVVTGERYLWNGWAGSGPGNYVGLDNPASITLNGPINETASWAHQFYLAVVSQYDTPGSEDWYDSGTTAYATLGTNPVNHGNGTRRVFTAWTGDTSGTDYAQSNPILMDGPKMVAANWKTQYLLTLTKTSGGFINPSISEWWDVGTLVTVTAAPDVNYLFHHWELDTVNVGSISPHQVTMNTAHTLHAVFTPIITGGSSATIQSPQLTWMSLNMILVAAVLLAAASSKKLRRRRASSPQDN